MVTKFLKKLLFNYSAKSFRDDMSLVAACFLTAQVIWCPFSKGVIFLNIITAMFCFWGYLDTNNTRKRIFISIGMILFFLVILISYNIIQI